MSINTGTECEWSWSTCVHESAGRERQRKATTTSKMATEKQSNPNLTKPTLTLI